MPKLFDADGNELEAFTKDDLEAEIKKATTSLEEKLKSYSDKEFNFKQLRDKVLKGEELTEKEKQIYEREKNVEEKEKTFQQKVVESWRGEAYFELVGDDQDLKKKIDLICETDLAALSATTKEEWRSKIQKALVLAGESKTKVENKLSRAMGLSGAPLEPKPKDYSQSEDGKRLAQLMGLSIDLPENK